MWWFGDTTSRASSWASMASQVMISSVCSGNSAKESLRREPGAEPAAIEAPPPQTNHYIWPVRARAAHMSRAFQHARWNSRLRDIAESQALLLELVTSEPTLNQCFKIIESTCLSQGIHCRVDNAEVSEAFQRHLDEFYVPFCKAAIRAFFTYGFVPWRARRISRGDEVPEVIPPGTFSWHTELGPVEQGRVPARYGERRPIKMRYSDDDTRMVIYRVTPNAGGWKETDIDLYIFQPPALDISMNSVLHATVPSPLSHTLVDYKNLRQAQIRRSNADAWNTTAKIISTFEPKLRVEDNPSQYLMDFTHESYYEPPALGQSIFPPLEAHNVWQRESVMRKQFADNPSTHMPDVYALPRDHHVAAQQMLAPCEDLQWLLEKYRRDVCALTGVPFEMVVGKESGGHETVRKTIASGRLFSTNMHEICRHLQNLLAQVYRSIYKKDSQVEFLLVPMPRLEVETIQDFKVLFEIGALTPDMSLHLSRILLGEAPTGRKRQRRETGGAAKGEEEPRVQPNDAVKEAWGSKGSRDTGLS